MKTLSLILLLIPITILSVAQQNNYLVNPGNGNGLRFWDSSDNYKIHMGTGTEYFYGPVNDYSIKTNMNGGTPGRGWTWGVTGQVPVAAINSQGNMQIAGTLTANNQFKVIDSGSPWNIGFGMNGDPARFVSADVVNSAVDTDPLELVYSRGAGVIVGTSSTSKYLQVYGSLRANNNFRLDGPSGTSHSEMQFYRADGVKFASIGQGSLSSSNSTFDIQHFNGNDIRFLNNGTEQLRILASNGNVGIGTPSPDAKLAVAGQVHAQEVKVSVTVPGPDYVFEKDYQLTSLEEIKNYIDQNKHLPEVPSAKEMEKNGIQLGEMNILLLKKIEELTLYVIEQNKKMEILSEKVKTLETNK